MVPLAETALQATPLLNSRWPYIYATFEEGRKGGGGEEKGGGGRGRDASPLERPRFGSVEPVLKSKGSFAHVAPRVWFEHTITDRLAYRDKKRRQSYEPRDGF